MKPKKFVNVILLLMIILFSLSATAQETIKSTGIGLRGSYYKMSTRPTQVTVINYGEYTQANVGGGGGWLYLYSRINPNMLIECSIGAVGKVEEQSFDYNCDNEVNVQAMIPLLAGLRLELLSPTNQSAIRPYLSIGAGSYWVTDVFVVEHIIAEEVTVKTSEFRGGYLGAGLDFRLCEWCAINFDVKRHFVDFNKNHEMSGFDYGLGFTIMWGNFRL